MSAAADGNDPSLTIINAFDFPVPVWNPTRASYRAEVSPAHALGSAGGTYHDDGPARLGVYRARLQMIRQRLPRSEHYVSGSGSDTFADVELVTIDSLLGNPGRKCVLGVLSQLEEGEWVLEDESNQAVKLQLDSTVFSSGLFTEGGIILAIGRYSDAETIFAVDSAHLPPAEQRRTSLGVLGAVDLFAPRREAVSVSASASAGRPRKRASKYEGRLASARAGRSSARAQIPEDAEFVVLSDVHLDNPLVLSKLKEMFDAYAEDPPALFIMFGNFLAREERHEGMSAVAASAMREGFSALAELLSGFPQIARNSRFLFIPGPEDGGHTANVLPHQPIPRVFTEPLREKLRHVHLGTNPCRIRYYGVDITLFREDLVTKLRRNSKISRQSREPPPAEGDASRVTADVVQTIVDQGHLSPLSLSIRPFSGQYDHSMWLYPLPDVVICADSFDAYEETHARCSVLNPGSFSSSDHSFVYFSPADLGTEECFSFCRG
jgi:DNA polymerase epsilon subunit 2